MQHPKKPAFMTRQKHEGRHDGPRTNAHTPQVALIRRVGHAAFGIALHTAPYEVGRLWVPEPTRPKAAYPLLGRSC